jgi:hypothetical protein
MAMSKKRLYTIIALIAVVIVVLATVFWFVGTYNSLVRESESIDSQWA